MEALAANGNVFFFEWEVSLIVWIQSWLGSFGTTVANIFSFLGEEYVMVAIFAFLYYWYDKEAGKRLGASLMTTLTWNPLIKNIFLRLRPYMAHSSIRCLRPVDTKHDIMDIAAQGYSFPSGHSMNSAGFYGGIAAYFKKKWMFIAAIALTFLVGVSRFAVGVHYPTDVLVGWAGGVIVVLLTGFLLKVLKDRKWIAYLILILISLPGWFYCKSNDFYSGFGMQFGFFAAVLFEEKFVHFKNTKNPINGIVRIAIGIALYFGLGVILKLPFPKEVLEAGDFLAYFIRAARYAVIVFAIGGPVPLLFPYTDKLGDAILRKLKKQKD